MVRVIPTESQEQIALFEWAAYQTARLPGIELMYHIPNGGRRDAREAARFKAEGVKAGYPDICLPVARNGYHGLYIELKRVKGGRVSEAQERCMESLQAQGYQVEVCKGCEEAVRVIEEYMGGG
ncbi:VRR-NUC domain-containing protein [Eubacteriales bacterium OttesenSCG-928-M02]|nr:VRR-NUC domain-containing protein [Eubacteriales bacterium OttesenSCG-928-M02]